MDLPTFDLQFGERAKGSPVRLLGVRNFYVPNGGRDKKPSNIYDDAIFRCIAGMVTEWRASTDPGQYYIRHPMNPKGCAQLQEGLWWFRHGLHLNLHTALIQDSEMSVLRLDECGHIESSESGWFGLNNHSGGAEYQIGKFSAGCQIIHCPEGAWGATWQAYYQPILEAAPRPGRVPYLLVSSLKAEPVALSS